MDAAPLRRSARDGGACGGADGDRQPRGGGDASVPCPQPLRPLPSASAEPVDGDGAAGDDGARRNHPPCRLPPWPIAAVGRPERWPPCT